MKNFIKIKKKFMVNALLCAIVIGVGVGAFAAATPIAVCKLLELLEMDEGSFATILRMSGWRLVWLQTKCPSASIRLTSSGLR